MTRLYLITDPKYGLARGESSLCICALSLSESRRVASWHTRACPCVAKPPSPRTHTITFIHSNKLHQCWKRFMPGLLFCSLFFNAPCFPQCLDCYYYAKVTVFTDSNSDPPPQVMDEKSCSFFVLCANYDCSLVGYSSLTLKILSKIFCHSLLSEKMALPRAGNKPFITCLVSWSRSA